MCHSGREAGLTKRPRYDPLLGGLESDGPVRGGADVRRTHEEWIPSSLPPANFLFLYRWLVWNQDARLGSGFQGRT